MTLTRKQLFILLALLSGILFFASDERPTPAPVSHTIAQTNIASTIPQTPQGKYDYLEITSSCDPYFDGLCIHAYAGPGTEYEKRSELRNGMIFKIKSRETVNGQVWYHVYFDEWLRYPERVEGDWYIPAVAGRVVTDDGEKLLGRSKSVTSKRIVVDLSEHMIHAYDGNKHFMTTKVSTGISLTPTPQGTFTVYKKTPSRYMQGPLPGVSDIPFDLPGVPWNLYFTQDGAVIHGSYWHDRYGTEQSNGCINLPPEVSKILYDWADLGTTVTIQD